MPRRSSGARPARVPSRANPVRNSPQPVNHAPPPAVPPSRGSMMGEIGSTIAQGMAFGTGSAVAHRAVDAVLGPRTIQHETVAANSDTTASGSLVNANARSVDNCNIHSKAFQDCIEANHTDVSKCQFYLDMLNECRRSSGSVLGV